MEAARATTLQAHFASPGASPRPVMTSLNGDNAWLLSFPRPVKERVTAGKVYYHMVFEPWLNGPTSLWSSWLVHIRMSSPPAIQDVAGIEAIARQIETAAAKHLPGGNDTAREEHGGYDGLIDAIFLGHREIDHVHQPTLRLFDKRIPVIAASDAVDEIKPWGHFETIISVRDLDSSNKSWRTPELHPGAPLPSWLTAVRLTGQHVLNYCMAIIWTHTTDDGLEVHEGFFDSPHGSHLEGPFEAFLETEPRVERLAMMHGLKESFTGSWMTTLGAKAGLAMHRKLGGIKYWMLTHNSELWYSGILMRAMRVRDTPRTLEWALEEEKEKQKESGDQLGAPPNLVQVENGGCFVLV